MSSPGGPFPFADVTGRMAIFGRLFGEQMGISDPGAVPRAEDLVALVKVRIPRVQGASEDPPLFEAAAFIGEWFRERVAATWIAEGPLEPQLHVSDPQGSTVYLLPIVHLLRTAGTAGYDGLAELFVKVVEDVGRPHARTRLDDLRVTPERDRPRVVAWAQRHEGIHGGAHASLWRRCSACATILEESLDPPTPEALPEQAAIAAGILSQRPFACPCGGPPGESMRFLMIREEGGERTLGDVLVTGRYTRIACWLVGDDWVEGIGTGAFLEEGVPPLA